MKKNKFIISILVLMGIIIMACEPMLLDKPDIGSPPDSTQLSFEITPSSDAFHYTITNTSSIVGIASWDFGNGAKGEGEEAIANYIKKGTYPITLTLVTNGGTASKTIEHIQTEDDFSVYSDPLYIMLSGGTAAPDGKIWVLDSLGSGHFGISAAEVNWPEWWSAYALQKTGAGAYDDEFIFNIQEFVFTNLNNGDSYVNIGVSDNPLYSNPVPVDGVDVKVDYNPAPGEWSISESEGVNFINLSGTTPLFFGFDCGGDRTFRIDSINDDILKLSYIGFDANRWYYQLIPKGYVKPVVAFDLTDTPTANTNEHEFALINVSLPEGSTVGSIDWDFGDGETYQASSMDETPIHVFKFAGDYTVKVVITVDGEMFEKTVEVNIANNHPDFAPVFTATATPTANPNEYDLAVVMTSTPAGVTIDKIVWDADDGNTYTGADYLASQLHVYDLKGQYTVTATLFIGDTEFSAETSVVVADNLDTYIIPGFMMYSDFGETQIAPWQWDQGGVGTGGIATVANPDVAYPNTSTNVGHITKDGSDWANAFIVLPNAKRFDISTSTKLKFTVRGTAGQEILLKLENTDRGGNAWQTGVEVRYWIKHTGVWEVAEFDLAGVGAGFDWTGDIYTSDVTTDPNFSSGFYDVARIMINPGNGGTHDAYIDDFMGPHIGGMK